MPIDSQHPVYVDNIQVWNRCRDAYVGEDAVKAQGTKYLPLVDKSQDSTEYQAYKTRATYYEAVGRSIDGFVGAIARKDPVFTMATKLNTLFMEDATADGVGLYEFVKQLCVENLLIGRGGILVDFDDDLARPFFKFYPAEAITNWFPDCIVLKETVYETDPADQFKQVAVNQYRQLHLAEGAYTVTIWRQSDTTSLVSDGWIVHEVLTPTMRGLAIGELPFYWLSSMGKTARIDQPPLLGMVNVALSHYRSSAELEHGRHFTAMPTLWVTGMSQDQPIRIGAGSAIILEDPAARVGYAEFSGAGLTFLENALEQKEHMLAVLGASVFQTPKKGVEAAETARIRSSGETSLLMGIVSAVEETLGAALSCAAKWLGVPDKIDVQLNREFADTTLEPPEMLALVQAFQAGAITQETLLYNLDQGGILQPETDIATEATAAQADKQARDKAQQALKPVKPASQ